LNGSEAFDAIIRFGQKKRPLRGSKRLIPMRSRNMRRYQNNSAQNDFFFGAAWRKERGARTSCVASGGGAQGCRTAECIAPDSDTPDS
jgi:hypothetical protein